MNCKVNYKEQLEIAENAQMISFYIERGVASPVSFVRMDCETSLASMQRVLIMHYDKELKYFKYLYN